MGCNNHLMDLQLVNKVVLITGGAKGIGAAITRAAFREVATAVIVDHDASAAKQLQSELCSSGAKCHVVTAELTDVDDCSRAIEESIRIAGRLDALINNAGVNDRIGLEHGSTSQFVESLQRVFGTYTETPVF